MISIHCEIIRRKSSWKGENVIKYSPVYFFSFFPQNSKIDTWKRNFDVLRENNRRFQASIFVDLSENAEEIFRAPIFNAEIVRGKKKGTLVFITFDVRMFISGYSGMLHLNNFLIDSLEVKRDDKVIICTLEGLGEDIFSLYVCGDQ